MLGHAEDTISKMAELKTLGISFAIDDFGAGYSSPELPQAAAG